MTADRNRPENQTPTPDGNAPSAAAKKTFVEPAISQPVDVLEATTFFQVAESGTTGFRKGNRK